MDCMIDCRMMDRVNSSLIVTNEITFLYISLQKFSTSVKLRLLDPSARDGLHC